ncbi:minor capsid protein [Capybara microvirus Cap3_SP_320]|nr:minor capsid protein [Capybara microvirus Cap3_SP_320]
MASQQFEYQKYYDSNKYQIASADMAEAGLNPLSAGSVGGSSVSSSGGSTPSPVSNNSLGSVAGVLTSLLGLKTQKDIAQIQSDTQLQIAREKEDAELYRVNKELQFEQQRLSLDRDRYNSDVGFRDREVTVQEARQASDSILNMSKVSLNSAQIREVDATTEKIYADIDKIESQCRLIEVNADYAGKKNSTYYVDNAINNIAKIAQVVGVGMSFIAPQLGIPLVAVATMMRRAKAMGYSDSLIGNNRLLLGD